MGQSKTFFLEYPQLSSSPTKKNNRITMSATEDLVAKGLVVGSGLLLSGLLIHRFLNQKKKKGNTWGYIISGAPASGKGTQCERIVAALGVVHLSTGDMLRDEVRRESELGKRAKVLMDQGNYFLS